MPVFQFILIGFLLMPTFFVAAWDIAVMTNRTEFNFYNNSQFMGNVRSSGRFLRWSAYDPVSGYLYVTELIGNDGIVRTNLLQLETLSSSVEHFQPVVSEKDVVHGIAFDPITDTLFWISYITRSIMKLTMNHSEAIKFPQPGILVHKFIEELPYAIAVDSCRGVLYWTDINPRQATIEKSNFDGSNRQVIVKTDLKAPVDIEVDMHQKKIYWFNLVRQYQIERANLDGSQRQFVTRALQGWPHAITISRDLLYWTDYDRKQLLSLPKDSVGDVEPRIVYANLEEVNDVVSNTLYLDIDTKECPALSPFMTKIRKNFRRANGAVEEVEEVANCSLNFCLNEGVQVNGTCVCKKGFTGSHCEIPVCLNYCIGMAKCELDVKTDQPVCHCTRGWGGDRCERDLCLDLCVNGGNCSLDNSNKTFCHCPNGFYGARCQYQSCGMDVSKIMSGAGATVVERQPHP